MKLLPFSLVAKLKDELKGIGTDDRLGGKLFSHEYVSCDTVCDKGILHHNCFFDRNSIVLLADAIAEVCAR